MLATCALINNNGNGNGGGWGRPRAGDSRDNNRNDDVHREDNCGGDVIGNGGDDNGNDDDNEGSGNNNDDGSDGDDNGGGENIDDSSTGDNNGGNGGDGGGGCETVTAAGIDTDNNQLKAAMDNGRGQPIGCPWFPCCNFLVSCFAFAFCKECVLRTTQSVR